MRSSSSEVSSPALCGACVSYMCCVMAGVAGSVPLVKVHIGLLADQVGVAASDTLYLRQRVHDLDFAIDLLYVLLVSVLCLVANAAISFIAGFAPVFVDVRWC